MSKNWRWPITRGWSTYPDTMVAMHSEDPVFRMHGAAEPVVGHDATDNLIVAFLKLVSDIHLR
jgi:hypothetical protein